jgi:FKBP-type peptidyl-prolyl cis-trans isomerase SlyD
MEIGPNKTALLSYKLTLAESGELIENVDTTKPAVFQFGVKRLLPAFEKNLNGKRPDDVFDFTLDANEAYGPTDPYAIFDIPKDTFLVDGKPDEKMLQVGNVIPMTDNNGIKHMGKIIKVLNDSVTMDFNHPLAGKDLRFTGVVVDVKESETN